MFHMDCDCGCHKFYCQGIYNLFAIFPPGRSETGVNSLFPGTSRPSATRCKPGANCPSSHSVISRQLSPLSVTEDSSAPILELQSRSSSGVCAHRVERQNRSGMLVTSSYITAHQVIFSPAMKDRTIGTEHRDVT